MKYIANGPVVVIVYLILMMPTYILPYFGSNSAAMVAIQSSGPSGSGTLFFTFLHIGCLVGLIIITFFRGKYVGKTWLIIFPILAGLFDFVPGFSSIPLVPTMMHLLVIILGVASAPVAKKQITEST